MTHRETLLVTGGTGTLGRQLVPRLRVAGFRVRIMSRRGGDARADLATGVGLSDAVVGCTSIVHLATGARDMFRSIRAVDVLGTARLLEEAAAAGVQHFVYISIVGVDHIPFVYYQAKLEAERSIVQQAAVGWSILRATQFHDLVDLFFRAQRRLPVLFLPKEVVCQPVDEGEVAERLCSAVLAGPAGRLPDFGGPHVVPAEELARAWLAANRIRRPLIRVPVPGRVGTGFRAGYHTVPEHRDGRVSWNDWLSDVYTETHAAIGTL